MQYLLVWLNEFLMEAEPDRVRTFSEPKLEILESIDRQYLKKHVDIFQFGVGGLNPEIFRFFLFRLNLAFGKKTKNVG